MGQNSATRTYRPAARLDAAIHGMEALKNVFPVTLGPNLTIAKGNLLVPGAATAVNAVQTITPPGSGNYTLSGINPITGTAWTAAPLAFNAADVAVQGAINTALTASGGGSVTVATLAVTFGGTGVAGRPVALMTTTAGSVANTTTGSIAGTHTLYAGSGTPTCWLQYDVVTDGTGMVTQGEWSQAVPYAPAYFAGDFYAADLPNLDAAAVTALKARFITGSLGVAGAILSIH